jgi:hypothetical protein
MLLAGDAQGTLEAQQRASLEELRRETARKCERVEQLKDQPMLVSAENISKQELVDSMGTQLFELSAELSRLSLMQANAAASEERQRDSERAARAWAARGVGSTRCGQHAPWAARIHSTRVGSTRVGSTRRGQHASTARAWAARAWAARAVGSTHPQHARGQHASTARAWAACIHRRPSGVVTAAADRRACGARLVLHAGRCMRPVCVCRRPLVAPVSVPRLRMKDRSVIICTRRS